MDFSMSLLALALVVAPIGCDNPPRRFEFVTKKLHRPPDYANDKHFEQVLVETSQRNVTRGDVMNFDTKVQENKDQVGNPNFFMRINSALRNQFSRFFKTRAAAKGRPKPGDGRPARQPTEQRFLNIFTVTQFENARCEAQGAASSHDGTCYHRLECSRLGGTATGPCAAGHGVCCVFRYGCGSATSQNTSYFEPAQDGGATTVAPTTLPPTTTAGPVVDPRINLTSYFNTLGLFRQESAAPSCVLTVIKRNPNIKQIRLDLLDFDIRGPVNGTCQTDRLVIVGQNLNDQIPIICGYNTGQHLYIDVSSTAGPVMIQVISGAPQNRRFKIKVSQVSAQCAAPNNCLQYYTALQSSVQSFNYEFSPRGSAPPQYFNNLNYAICIRKEAGYCTLTYTNVQDGQEYPFQLINVDSSGVSLIPPNQAGAEIFNCPDDFIVVNGVRLCGDRLNDGATRPDFRQNAPVTDASGGPFVLPVRTNASAVGRGFKLFYTQNRCA